MTARKSAHTYHFYGFSTHALGGHVIGMFRAGADRLR